MGGCYFHLPQSVEWNAGEFVELLAVRSLRASAKEGIVLVDLDEAETSPLRERHEARIARLKAALRGRELPFLAVLYHDERMIRNIEVRRDGFSVPPNAKPVLVIEQTLRKMGAESIGNLDEEMRIAFRFLGDQARIGKFTEQLKRLNETKDSCVKASDFEGAAAARDAAEKLRSELEKEIQGEASSSRRPRE